MDPRDEKLLSFCRDIVKIPSLATRERAVVRRVRDEMEALGYDEVDIDEFGNAVGVLHHGEGPVIVFDAHLDTVGVDPLGDWGFDPFGGWVEEGKLYGRGAIDMKGPAAAIVHGLARLVEGERRFRGTIVASLSIMEEVSEGVALAEVIDRYGADAVVIGEATDLRLVRAQRGRAEIALRTIGVPAHSSTPHYGVDAVRSMYALIEGMDRMSMPSHPFLGSGVQALTDIISTPYPAMSTVPWECRATFDRRLMIGETEESVLAELAAMIADVSARDAKIRAEAEIVTATYTTYSGFAYPFRKFLPAWEFPEQHPVVAAAKKALVASEVDNRPCAYYRFCTNGSLPARHFGVPTIGFGPGNEDLAHRKDEYIVVDHLLAAARGYAAIAEALSSVDYSR